MEKTPKNAMESKGKVLEFTVRLPIVDLKEKHDADILIKRLLEEFEGVDEAIELYSATLWHEPFNDDGARHGELIYYRERQ
jgi:hypothetical protein